MGLDTDLALLVLDFIKFPDVDVFPLASESAFASLLAFGRVGQRLGVGGCSVDSSGELVFGVVGSAVSHRRLFWSPDIY